jgi:hypothetical protein
MVGQPYNPDNCAFLSSQALNANQLNPNVPYSTNNTTHLILWDFVEKKILWVNSQTNLIESEIGGADLPTNVGNLVVNESGSVQSTLVREYTNGETNIFPIQTHTGTTQETIIKTIYIPANTYKIGDYFDQKAGLGIFSFVLNTPGFNIATFRTYYNSSPSLVGATLSDATTQNSNVFSELGITFGTGNFEISSNNTVRGGNIGQISNPFSYNNNKIDIFNITQDAYIIFSAELGNASDRTAVQSAYLFKAINAQKLVP